MLSVSHAGIVVSSFCFFILLRINFTMWTFFRPVFLFVLVVGWLYGTHRVSQTKFICVFSIFIRNIINFMNFCSPFLIQSKYIYMLPYLIYSVMGSIVFCIGFVVIAIAITFAKYGLGLMDSIVQVICSATSVNLKGIFDNLDGRFIFYIWFIAAACTGLFENVEKLS